MKNLVLGMALCLSVSGLVSAQDAVKALPNAYVLQFENEWVRIVRVRYEPFAKLPGHEHTRLASAYVYLNDGGPVIFKHVGKEYGAVTRPATKARSFRLYRGLEEIHEVENTSELPSEFLRVELKTDPKDATTLRGKFFSEAPTEETLERRQFENDQLRITRLIHAPGRDLVIASAASEPVLLIALSAATYTIGGTPSSLALEIGQERWIPAGSQERLNNVGAEPVELLRFDLKTSPLSTTP